VQDPIHGLRANSPRLATACISAVFRLIAKPLIYRPAWSRIPLFRFGHPCNCKPMRLRLLVYQNNFVDLFVNANYIDCLNLSFWRMFSIYFRETG
jgi:hypothetical protein